MGVILFYLGVIIEVLMVIIDKSAYTNPIEGRLFQITFLLFGLKVLSTKYSVKEWVAILMFGLLGVVSYLVTGRNEIIRVVAFIAACKDIDMKHCLKLVFWLTLTGCVMIVLLSVTGIYGAMSLSQDYGRGGVEIRYTLGMGHPNALHCMVWALTVLGLYVYAEKMKWYYYVLLMALNVGTFLLTDSKTSFLVIVVTLLIALFMQYATKLREKKWMEGTWQAILLGCVGFSILAALNSEAAKFAKWDWNLEPLWYKELMGRLDNVLNGRIFALAYNKEMYGTLVNWTPFGKVQNIEFFDMGWVRLFYWYGIIPATIFILMCSLLIHYARKTENYMCVVLVLSVAIYTVIEAHMVSVYIGRNYVFFLLGMYVSQMLHLTSEKETYLWNIARS